eukprot:30826_1
MNNLQEIVLVMSILTCIGIGQNCLSEPPELEWDDSTGVNQGTLIYDVQTFESSITGYPTSFTTRVHNGGIPSPTLRLKRNQTYTLTLINNLPPDTPIEILNIIKELDITNIHTHGLHISGETPADNIFDAINGGQQMTYVYRIPCDHSGGTFWYHPHHHGSTAVQVGGGSVGAIIVEDSPQLESLPLWLETMGEMILVIQHLDSRRVRQIGRNIDNIFNADNFAVGSDFWIINGKYQPDICMTTGVWKRFRIVNADLTQPNEYVLDANNINSPCEIYLISRDGVLIHGRNNEVPRRISTRAMYFSVASRADVAVRCNVAGIYTITTNNINPTDNVIIANIVASDPFSAHTNVDLTPFNPIRPQYLHSLLDVDVSEFNTETISIERFGLSFTINGQLFNGKDEYLIDDIQAGSLQQWTILRANAHPFHIHINHFQVVNGGITGSDTNWTHIGDWLDVLNNQGIIRFSADRFGGKVVIHCHILQHEDTGTMALARIEGGCDALGNDIDGIIGSCDDNKNCNLPFFRPPTAPPTDIPQCKDTNVPCSLNEECCSGRCRGRNGLCR